MKQNLASAAEDFERARAQAKLESVLARLTGQSTELLSYEEVRQKLRARERSSEHLEDVPLDAIVGSVGRYKDFTRSFLPKQASSKERWARVEMAVTGLAGVPPIEVYKVGDAYFVRDGNHRVSVARQLGATSIQAYVTEVETRVPLSPDVEPDDLILKAEYAAFLEETDIDEVRPRADLTVTVPGQYEVLEEHIEVHRHFMGLEQERHIPYEEAVAHWYDEVYMPVVRLIRQRGILWYFPERTDTDLYLWLAEHRAVLEEELGWEVSPDVAADDLVERFSQQPGQVLKRVGRRVLDTITPDELDLGPTVGQWREQRLEARQDHRLFADILVAINGEDLGWAALDQALILAQREGAHLRGLHVVSADDDQESAEAQAIQTEFDRRCAAAGIHGRLVLDVGSVQRAICHRARWTDLITLSLNYPPGPGPIARLSSGMSTIIRRCPRPVLTVPGEPSPLRRPLLAYDGSPKAKEALFVATYVSGQWALPLTVLTVLEGDHVASEAIEEARGYLEAHGVQADFVTADSGSDGAVAALILGIAVEQGCDLILIGGYGHSPAVELVLGSAVDGVLRESRWPALICR